MTNILKNSEELPVPVSLRSEKSELFYSSSIKSGKTKDLVDEERIREWKNWAIIENSYPYNYAFKVHHLLIPKRVVREEELSEQEKKELENIFEELKDVYDCRIVNFKRKQSIKSHFHIHLLTFKDRRQELEP